MFKNVKQTKRLKKTGKKEWKHIEKQKNKTKGYEKIKIEINVKQ